MLHPQANSLHNQIGEITERRAAADRSRQGDKSFMQLRQAQQMASMVGRKKDEVTAKLERLQVGGSTGVCTVQGGVVHQVGSACTFPEVVCELTPMAQAAAAKQPVVMSRSQGKQGGRANGAGRPAPKASGAHLSHACS
jgi:hypothetical protein